MFGLGHQPVVGNASGGWDIAPSMPLREFGATRCKILLLDIKHRWAVVCFAYFGVRGMFASEQGIGGLLVISVEKWLEP
jgi:hypothetical protein